MGYLEEKWKEKNKSKMQKNQERHHMPLSQKWCISGYVQNSLLTNLSCPFSWITYLAGD